MTQHPFLPVPVQNRADGWTPEKQWKFVEALAQTASITDAVRAVGMSRRSAHRLRMHPEASEFRAAWDAAPRWADDAAESAPESAKTAKVPHPQPE